MYILIKNSEKKKLRTSKEVSYAEIIALNILMSFLPFSVCVCVQLSFLILRGYSFRFRQVSPHLEHKGPLSVLPVHSLM